ncbi:hypothetical protein [Poseidonibacter ostreae]|uniref:Uncharacterized protein n=1 Tax=Poseidonibacter ostreae TaxID=2654171 RepID=A0A6L4WX37_9BACT|nr:hypothetical protein [Poseidonibacter ostreae]KAB7891419.1 hypothetical protein GBG19_00860 [Poseidonibacter ostreae]
MDKIFNELKAWCIVFNNNENSSWSEVSETQAEEISMLMLADGYYKSDIEKAWDRLSHLEN